MAGPSRHRSQGQEVRGEPGHRGGRPGPLKRRRPVGLFGGTFDPPHVGHLALAEWARERLALDQVVFIPAGSPPHKRGRALTESAHRVAMTRLAVRGNAAFTVSTIETRRSGPSFTLDTLRAFAGRWPGAPLDLIVGADMFETFGSWREPAAILAIARLVVALRPGTAKPRAGRWERVGRGVVWLDNPGLDVSSSAVRARARAGRSVRYLVPDRVAAYIGAHRLYRSGR